jgi:diphosphomevalonate decarboxylase
MEKAIKEKDFETFCDLTMKDSDSFHDVCSDTNPPIYYLNETSKKIQSFVRSYNKYKGKDSSTYTFDAGPNAFLFVEKKNLIEFASFIFHYFPITKR